MQGSTKATAMVTKSLTFPSRVALRTLHTRNYPFLARSPFSTTAITKAMPEPTRTPKPIPFDIGSNASASNFFTQQSSSATKAVTAGSSSRTGGFTSRFGKTSFVSRFGEPIFKVVVFTTATTLAMQLLYYKLSLEEYKISSSQRITDLETEIKALKDNAVHHASGGRGEFI